MKWDWENFYDRAYNWVLTTGPRLIMAVALLLIGLWLIRVFIGWMRKGLERRNFNPSLRYFLLNLTAISLQILLILMATQIVGIQLTFLTAIIAGFSVAAGLALSGTLQNFVSGILILMLKPYRVGDNISTQGQEGKVTAIQMFYTTVLTYDNKTITIPNGQLSNNVVVNLSKEGNRRIDIDLKFSYGIDENEIKKVIEKTLQDSKDILSQPKVRIGITLLEADKYTLSVNAWTSAHGFIDSKIALQEKILKDLREAGIKLPGM